MDTAALPIGHFPPVKNPLPRVQTPTQRKRVSKAAAKLVAQAETKQHRQGFAAQLAEASKRGPGPLKHVLFVDDDHCGPNKFETANIVALKEVFSGATVFRYGTDYSVKWNSECVLQAGYRFAQVYTGNIFQLGAQTMAHAIQMAMTEYGMRPNSQVRTFVASSDPYLREFITKAPGFEKWVLCDDIAHALILVSDYNNTL